MWLNSSGTGHWNIKIILNWGKLCGCNFFCQKAVTPSEASTELSWDPFEWTIVGGRDTTESPEFDAQISRCSWNHPSLLSSPEAHLSLKMWFFPLTKNRYFSYIIFWLEVFLSLLLSVPFHLPSHADLPPFCLLLDNKQASIYIPLYYHVMVCMPFYF